MNIAIIGSGNVGSALGAGFLKAKHNVLTVNELKFLDLLVTDPVLSSFEDISKHRHYLFDAFYTGYLEEFKAKNQKYLYVLDKYQEKINELEFRTHGS